MVPSVQVPYVKPVTRNIAVRGDSLVFISIASTYKTMLTKKMHSVQELNVILGIIWVVVRRANHAATTRAETMRSISRMLSVRKQNVKAVIRRDVVSPKLNARRLHAIPISIRRTMCFARGNFVNTPTLAHVVRTKLHAAKPSVITPP